MKTIKNFALAMLLVWIFGLGFNSCANLVKNFVLKNIKISYEDKSEHILKKHQLFYGTLSAWAAYHNKKDIQGGYKNGVLAGEVAYFGKKIARKKGLGIVGLAIHSLGVSMLENQILNKPLLSRYKLFLPPTSLEFDIQEGFSCQFLFGSLTGILVNIANMNNNVEIEFSSKKETVIKYLVFSGLLFETAFRNPAQFLKEIFSKKDGKEEDRDHLELLTSLLVGNPVFVIEKVDDGLNIGGIITVKKDLGSLSHETIHTCQYREISIVNLFFEKKIFENFPLLFSQDLAYILIHDLFGGIEEEEPEAYDRIYKKY